MANPTNPTTPSTTSETAPSGSDLQRQDRESGSPALRTATAHTDADRAREDREEGRRAGDLAQGTQRELDQAQRSSRPNQGASVSGSAALSVGDKVSYNANGTQHLAFVTAVLPASEGDEGAAYANLVVFNEDGATYGQKKVRRGTESGQWSPASSAR